MADLTQLETALRNADKAGDTEAAQALAKAIVSARQQQGGPLPANAGLANFAATVAGLPVDTAEGAVNLMRAAVGTGNRLLGGSSAGMPELISGTPGGSQYFRDLLNQAAQATGARGLSPDNPNPGDTSATNQYEFTSRGGFIPGNALPAAASIVAEKVLGPQYAGVGSMLPGAIAQAGRGVIKAVADPATVQKNQQVFRNAGTYPDVAQATESKFLSGLTNVISRFPGGQGVIAKFRETQQEQLGDAARTGVTAESAGREIKAGILGEGGFLDRTKAQWQQLDNELALKVGGATSTPQNTVSTLDRLTAVIPGAERTSGALVNPKLAAIKQNIAEDLKANNGAMPYEALRSLRTRVGSMIDDSIIAGIPNGELKQLYGSLTRDLEETARAAGAGKEFSRQNNYYHARQERIENTLNTVLGDGKTFEQIFKSVAPTDVDSVNKIRRVYRSLDEDQRQVVTEAIVNRLGRAAPNRQDLTGEKFSSETFLTNWSRINPSAKTTLFSDSAMRGKLDSIAAVASDIRDTQKVFQAHSDAQSMVGAAGVYSSPAVALGMWSLAPLAIGGASVAGSYGFAKMLTDPKTIDWLAKSAKVQTQEQMTAQLGRLAVIYNQTKDEELKKELGDYVSALPPRVASAQPAQQPAPQRPAVPVPAASATITNEDTPGGRERAWDQIVARDRKRIEDTGLGFKPLLKSLLGIN